MTKQEKSEMIKLIGNVKPFYVETIAEALYDAGYRKVDDVRKKTTKEILNGMLKKMYKLTGCGVPYHVRAFIKEFAEEYGVEVEE